ncbi:MAG: ABC transporter ATP-binding protein [Firmicutes bacterium]|nr:ABC transporter ATP-binding protein [Bacillota bacterium]
MKLVIKGLKKSFDNKEVLKDISFEFEEGKIYGLLGRNGAGKTTLFNCLNEDLDIDGGEFFIETNDGEMKKIHSDEMGYVLSTPVVPEFLTGREFLKFFMEINEKKIVHQKSIDEWFDFIKIEVEDRDKLLKEYSHGMKNKMQMLIYLILNPSIILLDEPLTSFDVVVAEEMKKLLKEMKKEHILIFSTHIMELALDLCDEIVLLNQGKLERVNRNHLDNEEFKEKIIEALKGEDHA